MDVYGGRYFDIICLTVRLDSLILWQTIPETFGFRIRNSSYLKEQQKPFFDYENSLMEDVYFSKHQKRKIIKM